MRAGCTWRSTSARGLPHFQLVGLPDASVRESRDRVRAAIRNSGFDFPVNRITINLAPGDVRKAGPAFDLPIALGMLAATGVVTRTDFAGIVHVGELSLDGAIQPARGVLPIAAEARRRGAQALLLPYDNLAEAAVVSGLRLLPVRTLTRSGRAAESGRRANGRAAACPAAVAPSARRRAKARPSDLVRPARPGVRAARARGRRRRRPQPADDRPAGRRQDDAGATAAGHPAAAVVRGVDRGHDHSLGGRPTAARRRPAHGAAVPRAASHHLRRRARRRRHRRRGPAK